MSAADDIAAATNQATGQVGAVSARLMVVTALNVGPPATVNLSLTPGGPTVIQGARLGTAYYSNTPVVGDVVYVLITQSGGSRRARGRILGGNVFVVDRIAF